MAFPAKPFESSERLSPNRTMEGEGADTEVHTSEKQMSSNTTVRTKVDMDASPARMTHLSPLHIALVYMNTRTNTELETARLRPEKRR